MTAPDHGPTTTSPTSLDLRAICEAVLFVAEAPVPASELAEVLERPVREVEALLAEMAADLESRSDRGVVLRKVAGGWRLYTRPETVAYLERFAVTPTATRLSQAALETLAIVAYRQPVSRAQVSEIRGVDADSALRTLERRGLIRELGRLDAPGNPVVYGTTELFLEKLGLDRIDELPPLADHVPSADVVERFEETFRTDG